MAATPPLVSANTANVKVTIAANGWQTIDLSVSTLTLSSLNVANTLSVTGTGTFGNVISFGNMTLEGSFVSPTRGRMIIGDGSGWHFYISNSAADLYDFDDKGNLTLDYGNLIVTTGQIKLTAYNAGMEIGSITQGDTPYIDFHSSGNNIDYDARLIASGGNANTGSGTLSFDCADVQVGGKSLITPAWQNPTLINVAAYGSSWAPPQWYQDSDGRVHLRGLIKATTTVPYNTDILSGLPGAKYQAIFNQMTQTGADRFDATTSGTIRYLGLSGAAFTSGDWISLEGISYQTK